MLRINATSATTPQGYLDRYSVQEMLDEVVDRTARPIESN